MTDKNSNISRTVKNWDYNKVINLRILLSVSVTVQGIRMLE